MAVTPDQELKALMILFPDGLTLAKRDAYYQEVRGQLADFTPEQETVLAQILTDWDAAYLDASEITAQATNKGYREAAESKRRLIRRQMVALLGYDPGFYGRTSLVGRG